MDFDAEEVQQFGLRRSAELLLGNAERVIGSTSMTFRVHGRPRRRHRECSDERGTFAALYRRQQKAAEVAANQGLDLAGPTGLEPATSGVTGRGSRVSREKKFYRL